MANVDGSEPEPRHPIRDGMPTHDLPLQRCRDCEALMAYGPAICSFCLSEHLEWVLDNREGKGHSGRPQ